MRNRWLVNLLLLALVIALGALMRRELERERRVATLTDLLPDSVTEISLERPDLPLIRLVRRADGWHMESPYRVRADGLRIGKLLGIATTGVQRSLPEGTGTERLGLTADSPRLTLNGLVLQFGDLDPINRLRYVAIGEQVHLIGDGFAHHLMALAHAFVDRTLLPPEFRADAGTLNGVPLSPEQLAELTGLTANDIVPLGSELAGRLLSLTSEQDSESLRFLISNDGLSWARLDLRLRYLLKKAPAWAVMERAPESAELSPQDPGARRDATSNRQAERPYGGSILWEGRPRRDAMRSIAARARLPRRCANVVEHLGAVGALTGPIPES